MKFMQFFLLIALHSVVVTSLRGENRYLMKNLPDDE